MTRMKMRRNRVKTNEKQERRRVQQGRYEAEVKRPGAGQQSTMQARKVGRWAASELWLERSAGKVHAKGGDR